MFRKLLLLAAAAFGFTALSSASWAMPLNQEVILDVHRPVAVPGQVLTPGRYEVLSVSPEGNVLRFIRPDGSSFLESVSYTTSRIEPTGNVVIQLGRLQSGTPAIMDYFLPGSTSAATFHYPAANRPVRVASASPATHAGM